jgi:hypothetical protein
VAIHGNTIAVGGWGTAYLFNATTGQQVAKLNPSDPTGQFGISVALNDDVVLVGSNSDRSRGEFTGAAFVFDLATRQQLLKIVPDDALGSLGNFGGDNFGIDVALDGNHAIIGSPLHSRINGQGGAAYVYDVTNGALLDKMVPPLPTLVYPENFGYRVDIQGRYAVVGAVSDSRRGSAAGAAFLYDWTTHELVAELVGHDAGANSGVGYDVAFGDQIVMVGAPLKPAGGAYEFQLVAEPSSAGLALAALLAAWTSRRLRS